MPIGLELTDGLGRVWDLMAPDACPAVLAGMRGLKRPVLERVRGAATPALHGTRWAGWRATGRTVVLPLAWDSDTVTATVRDFMAGLVPDQPGMLGPGPCTLTAVLPDSTRWTIGMHLADDGDDPIDTDPELLDTLDMALAFDADVFWQGQPWSSTWQASAPAVSWMLASGGVAALSSSHTLASASVTNSGDVRAWPVWTITGPCTGASAGVGGHRVTLAAALAAGQSVVIDTDPEVGQMAVRDDGTDLTSSLTEVDFAPIEPGVVTPLEITLTGTGTISMSYRPLRLAIL